VRLGENHAGLSQQTTRGVPTNQQKKMPGFPTRSVGTPTNRGKARRYNFADCIYTVSLLNMLFNRNSIRLAPPNYLGYGIYFITICTYGRTLHFADTSLGHVVLGHLNSLSTRHSFLLHAFCLMPDHLHFLSEGNSAKSNLLRFVNDFKQRTAVAHKKRRTGSLWQTSFYDHVLRGPDGLESVACYIWANPVRKRLCKDAGAYPLSGSQTLDWKKLCGHSGTWQPPWKQPMPGSPRKMREKSPQTGAKPGATMAERRQGEFD
jgi:putative transposase